MVEAWVVGLALGYLLGSIPVGLWLGRLVGGLDLRSGGSGKIGTTNVYRRLGLKWSLLVFTLDVSKGIVPVAVVRIAFDSPTGEVLAALSAIIGHVYPVYAGFRGGRAAATGYGALLMLTPTAAAVAILLGLVLLGVTRIMSLTVLLGLTVSAITQGLLVAYGGEPDAYYGFVAASWAIVTFAHRDNIQRLVAGTERVLGRPRRTEISAPNAAGAGG
ncbi:MAG: glycerol-3-phosphate 1-O-acyltransferase PlsY [Dehalococcoidia bacterium]